MTAAYVSVTEYGETIRVICDTCNINQPYDTWRRANNECRAHNLFMHVEEINWAS